ncbi:scavenger receptor class B member 1-like [Galleria mellonella]|uniref:Scavenger receptor class B member 1-like n=1 Tax=Galleria mellonella TaxID=7137 RepID=A0A6J1X1Y0_GALME|nr:scavenger receptor class B member 1-like [Galleria mellonella]
MDYISKNRRFNPQSPSRKKLLICFSIGISSLIIGIVLMTIDPVLIIAQYISRVAKDTVVHKALSNEMSGVFVDTYLFNVTNPEEFLSGEHDKLKVEEVGPFTYQEIRSQEDLELVPEAGLMRYSPRTKTVFVPEKSIAHPKDVMVTMPNIAYLSMTSMVSTMPFFTKMGFNLLAMRLNSQSIKTMTVFDYLWGYKEDLITLGNNFLPGWIGFGKMGILDRMYDNTVDYRIDLGATNDDKFEIKKMNGRDRLTVWDDKDPDKRSKCNEFHNAYEGIAYPANMNPEKEIRIYRNVLCRFLELDFVETRPMERGVDGLVYRISNRTFTLNPDTECLCRRGMCIEGISDLSPCFYGLPLSLSAAHFTGANPKLYDRIEGMKPDPKRFSSEFIIEPKIGMVLDTFFSVQVNIVMRDVRFNDLAKKFADIVIPVAFFTIYQPPLTKENHQTLQLMYISGPYITLGVAITLLLLSAVTLSYWIRMMYWNWLCRQDRGIAFQTPSTSKLKGGFLTSALPLLR